MDFVFLGLTCFSRSLFFFLSCFFCSSSYSCLVFSLVLFVSGISYVQRLYHGCVPDTYYLVATLAGRPDGLVVYLEIPPLLGLDSWVKISVSRFFLK